MNKPEEKEMKKVHTWIDLMKDARITKFAKFLFVGGLFAGAANAAVMIAKPTIINFIS